MALNRAGQFVTSMANFQHAGRFARLFAALGVALVLSACNLFGPTKITEEAIVPPETLYESALKDMEAQRFNGAITTLAKLERQHPYSEFKEKAQLMTVYANFRIGKYEETVLAADRYMALYPASAETPYMLWLKGSAYYGQIKDITRDQALSRNAIETFQLLVSNYPKSDYAKDAREKMVVATDQMAGKEMSVGRYYLGNGQYTAAINRFRVVVEQYQTSTHIEEALYRLAEANLLLGLVGEAQTAAAVLGHNYPASSWYKQAFALLERQGLSPNLNSASPLARAVS